MRRLSDFTQSVMLRGFIPLLRRGGRRSRTGWLPWPEGSFALHRGLTGRISILSKNRLLHKGGFTRTYALVLNNVPRMNGYEFRLADGRIFFTAWVQAAKELRGEL